MFPRSKARRWAILSLRQCFVVFSGFGVDRVKRKYIDLVDSQ